MGRVAGRRGLGCGGLGGRGRHAGWGWVGWGRVDVRGVGDWGRLGAHDGRQVAVKGCSEQWGKEKESRRRKFGKSSTCLRVPSRTQFPCSLYPALLQVSVHVESSALRQTAQTSTWESSSCTQGIHRPRPARSCSSYSSYRPPRPAVGTQTSPAKSCRCQWGASGRERMNVQTACDGILRECTLAISRSSS